MRSKGFSLLELLVTLIILSVLMGLAYPCYQQYMQRLHRRQAVLSLMQISNALAQYHFKYHTYEGMTLTDFAIPVVLEQVYEITIDQQTRDTYIVSARPLFRDTQCGALSLNQLHEKSISGSGSVSGCW